MTGSPQYTSQSNSKNRRVREWRESWRGNIWRNKISELQWKQSWVYKLKNILAALNTKLHKKGVVKITTNNWQPSEICQLEL